MKLSISDAIKNDKMLAQRVQKASQTLEQVIGSTAASVAAAWRLTHDARSRPLVHLALSDFTGARVETQFAPEELDNEERLYARFYRIWGDVLQERSHKQLDQLLGKTQPGE